MKRFGLIHVLMLTPTQLLLIGIIALPAIWIFYLSLNESSYGRTPIWVGLENYVTVLTDRYFWRAFWNTFVVVNVVVYIELVMALGLAVIFAAGLPFRKIVLAIVLMPYAISEVVAVIIWKFLMDPAGGAIARPLAAMGLPALEWAVNPWHGLALVSLISIWLHLPFTFLILYAARLAVPADLYEAAHADGASAWQSFRYVTLPMLLPAILVALIFRYIFAFRLFAEVWLLTGGGPARMTEVLAVYLYKQGFAYNDFGRAAATGWIMVVLSGLIAALYMNQMYRRAFRSEHA